MNLEVHLVLRPLGTPTHDNFGLVESKVPGLQVGEILVENEYISVDPYLRGQMDDIDSYIEPFALDKVMGGDAVGRVIASDHPEYSVGEYVAHMLGWRKYAVIRPDDWAKPGEVGEEAINLLRKVDPELAPASAFIGVLGMPGLTAYAGILYVGAVKPTDVVFVSGAAGAVGSLAGQIAKQRGAMVIGSAGSDEKVRLLTHEFGFDSAFNYKNEAPADAIARLAPEGIDVYFDNVGGDHLEAALAAMRRFGRVVCCGYISSYNESETPPGPRNFWNVLDQEVTIRGILVPNHYDKWDAFYREVGPWIRDGRVQYRETVFEGLENAVDAFLGLFTGANIGKMLVKI
jgi:NADPH-dependent curcumin reductase CurA